MKLLQRSVATILCVSILCVSILCVSILCTPLAQAAFTDVPAGHKNTVSIMDLQERKVIQGYPDNTFRPDVVVNRAEALKFILAGIGAEVNLEEKSSPFKDIKPEDWHAPYVKLAKDMQIVNGNPDGSFAPGRTVTRAEFVKMLLEASRWDKNVSNIPVTFPDVPAGQWYTPYVLYSGYIGLLERDESGNLLPSKGVTRGEVAEMMYILMLLIKKNDPDYLTIQAQKQIASVPDFIAAGDLLLAKRATERSVDISQQAYKLAPKDTNVLAWAKIARSYDYAVASFIAGVKKNYLMAEDYAKKAIEKANEAVSTLDKVAPIADYIKQKSEEILKQIPKQ